MSDYLPPVIAKLVADTQAHNREVMEAGDVWVDTARRVRAQSAASEADVRASQAGQAAAVENASTRTSRAHQRSAQDATRSAAEQGRAARQSSGHWQAAAGTIGAALIGQAGAFLRWKAESFGIPAAMSSAAASIGPLIGKLFLLMSALSGAAALVSALPAALGALGGLGGVLFGAFNGIGDALKGYKADQDAAASSASSGASRMAAAARSIRDAYKGIENAQRQAARTARDGAEAIEAAAERVQDAMKAQARAVRDVQDAIKDQARAQRDAAESIVAAQRRVRDAARDAEKAEVSLDKARQQAAKTIAELQEKVSDLALDQEGAAIAVAEAEKAYYREMRSSESTELSRRKALYELNVARERQSDLERDAAETIAENNDAQAKGVEGADAVVDAKERLADTQERLQDATTDQARAEEDAAESIANAARRVADAREAEADAARDVVKAEQDLARTKRDAAEANEDAARAVADAMERLKDAQDAAAESAASAAGKSSKFAEAMAKLTQEGRDFVYKLIELKEEYKKIGDVAQKAALPGFTAMLEDSKALIPIISRNVGKLAVEVGNMARQWGAMFKNKGFQENFDKMLQNNIPVLHALNDGLLKVTNSWVKLGANKHIAQGFSDLLRGALTGIAGFFDSLDANGEDFGRVLTALGDILRVLTPAIGELAGEFAGPLADILEYIAGLLKEHEGHLGEWIKQMIALYAAFKLFRTMAKFGMLLTFASQITGLFPQLDKLTRRLKGVGKAMKGAGLIGGVATGLALADNFLPEKTEEQKNEQENAWYGPVSYGSLKDMTGAANQLLTDPASVAEEVGTEWQQMVDTWEKGEAPIQKFFGSIGTWSSTAATDISNWASGTSQQVSGWFEQRGTDISTFVSGAGQQVGGWFSQRGTDVSNFVTGAGQQLGGWFSQRGTDVSNFVTGTGQQLSGWASARTTEFTNWATNTGNTVSGWASRTASDVGTWAQTSYNNASTWLGNLQTDAGTWFGGLWNEGTTKLSGLAGDASTWSQTTLNNLQSQFSTLKSNASTWFGGMKDGAVEKGEQLLQWAQNLPQTIKNKLGDLKNLLVDKGREIVTGLWTGLQSMGTWLYENVFSWIKRVIPAPIAGALGINSPSRVAHDLIQWVPIGAEEALIEGARRVTVASRGLGTATASGFRTGLADVSIPAPAMATIGAGGAGSSGAPVIVENHFHIQGTVLAEQQLMTLVRTESNKYAGRNVTNGLGGG